MYETISETLDSHGIYNHTFLEILTHSGQLDVTLHRLLSETLDKRVTDNTWDYQLPARALRPCWQKYYAVFLKLSVCQLSKNIQLYSSFI